MDGKGMKVSCTLRSRAARGILIAELPRAKRAQRSTMGNKFGKLSIRENLVITSPYVHPYIRPYGLSG